MKVEPVASPPVFRVREYPRRNRGASAPGQASREVESSAETGSHSRWERGRVKEPGGGADAWGGLGGWGGWGSGGTESGQPAMHAVAKLTLVEPKLWRKLVGCSELEGGGEAGGSREVNPQCALWQSLRL